MLLQFQLIQPEEEVVEEEEDYDHNLTFYTAIYKHIFINIYTSFKLFQISSLFSFNIKFKTLIF